MIIATPTITHTGTRFLHRRVLRSPERYRVCSQGRQNPGSQGVVFHTHMFPQLRSVWEFYIEAGYPIVIPLMNPARNKISILEKRQQGIERFTYQWESMLELASKCSPMYLHLDSLDIREQQAEAICKRFKLPTEIDWTPNKFSGAVHNTHELEITAAMVADVPVEFTDFYEQTKIARQ